MGAIKNLGFLLLSICGLALSSGSDVKPVVFCYWGTWAYQYDNPSKFLYTDIDTELCTHVAYTFFGLDFDGNFLLLDEDFDIGMNGLTNFISLKEKNPEIVLVASLGGWSQGSANYSAVARDATKRANLNQQVVAFLKEYGFDGLDLDWEYPSVDTVDCCTITEDYDNFVTWLSELRGAFDNEGLGWIITTAVGAFAKYIGTSYNVPEMVKYVDMVNLMTYDLHGVSDEMTGANAPLYPQPSDTTDDYCVAACVEAWLEAGCPPEKLIVGIGSYGKAYTLADPQENGTGANITGYGLVGPWRDDDATWAYIEICTVLEQEAGEWTTVQQDDSYVYSYKDTMWIGYDNVATSYAKGQYAKSKNLGGVMTWSIDNDDFKAFCGESYGILRSAVKGYNGE